MRREVLQLPARRGGHVAARPSSSLKLALFPSSVTPPCPRPIPAGAAVLPRCLALCRRQPSRRPEPALLDHPDRGDHRLRQGGPSPLADKTALVLDLDGTIGEQKSGNLRSTALEQLSGEAVRKVQLRDVLNVLDAAAKDPKISAPCSCSTRCGRGLGDAARDRPPRSTASGRAARRSSPGARATTSASTTSPRRPTRSTCTRWAWSSWKASAATELLPRRARQGGRHRQPGARRHLQELGEPFIANEPSKAALEADRRSYNGALDTYTDGVEKARKLPAGR